MQMCHWRKSSGNRHTLVSNSTAARHRSNICVCFATKTSYEDVSVTVKDFHCDTNSCPWKLSFYENGCLTQQICCGKTETDFEYHIPRSGEMLVTFEGQSSNFINSSVQIRIIGGECTNIIYLGYHYNSSNNNMKHHKYQDSNYYSCMTWREQHTDSSCIGVHVNALSDYK